MLRRPSATVVGLSFPHLSFPCGHYRHLSLFARTAIRPTTRASHHPTNLPQLNSRNSSPSRKNSTNSFSKMATSSQRTQFVQGFVGTVALSAIAIMTYYYIHSRKTSTTKSDSSSTSVPPRTLEIDGYSKRFIPKEKVLQLLTPEECTLKLRSTEESYIVSRGNGVYRYDVNQLGSNNPIEEERVEQIIAAPSPKGESSANIDVTAPLKGLKTGYPMIKNASGEFGDWMFWGLFDGHRGWYTSNLLKRQLIPYVVQELSNLYSSPTLQAPPSSLAVDKAIQRAFTALDNEIVFNLANRLFRNPSKRFATESMLPAYSGSFACTGDSRAVLGRKDPKTGKWLVDVLSIDQNCHNIDETNRLRKEHPGEEQDIIKRGYVLGGLEPTRVFGDADFKLPVGIQDKLREYWAIKYRPDFKTPPYLTAEPIITTRTLTPAEMEDAFVVMGTDGLWDKLTNEQVVGLVGKWIDWKNGRDRRSWFGNSDDLNVAETKGREDAKKPEKKLNKWVWQDRNAATHLIRNALGGENPDEISGIMSLPSPLARYHRDDITVTVIFLGDLKGEGAKEGGVFVNEEATGGGI